MLDGFHSRLRNLGWSLAATPLAAVTLVLFVLTATGTALIVVWVGIPMLLIALAVARPIAQLHRRMIPRLDSGPVIESPYLPSRSGNVLVRLRHVARDPAIRRDAAWLFADGTVGLALAVIGIVESVLDLVFWFVPPGLALRLHAALGRSMLSVSEKSRLALRVEQLTESRAETVDTRAAELRRIERDLHDGAQARLVALGMNLALAEQQWERDPESARALVTEARTASSDALAELRDLVRGIHPPVLSDRGLDGAVRALALAMPVPVDVEIAVDGRLPPPIESAAYFAVAEVLTNVVKHAAARRAGVEIHLRDERLTMRVTDDGGGGADARNGTGIRGIERRLAAFDGTIRVKSPPGGPTDVVMVLPCASSSPKISPSSGTA